MMRFDTPAALALFACWVWAVAAVAGSVTEPQQYRETEYRAPVPETLSGARVVTNEQALELWTAGSTVFIDVLPYQPRPEKLPKGTIWREKKRMNIPGSTWLPNVGYGRLNPALDVWFRGHLQRLTGEDPGQAILFYCLDECWMSWNAAKRAMEYGYTNVIWYPQGTDGWNSELNDLEEATPEPFKQP